MFLYCSRLSSCTSLLCSIYVTTKYGNWTLNLRYVRQTLVPAQYCVSLPLEALILSFWPFYPCICDFLVFILSWLYPWLTRYYYLLINRLQTSTFNASAFTKSTQLSLFIFVHSLPRVFLSLFSSVLVVPLVNYYNWTLRLLNAQSPVPTIHKSLSTAAQWSYLFNVVLTFTNFSCLSSLLSSWYHGPTTTTESYDLSMDKHKFQKCTSRHKQQHYSPSCSTLLLTLSYFSCLNFLCLSLSLYHHRLLHHWTPSLLRQFKHRLHHYMVHQC